LRVALPETPPQLNEAAARALLTIVVAAAAATKHPRAGGECQNKHHEDLIAQTGEGM
jgi:hypothetical protein